jgi:hypothetical protein
MPHGLGLGFHCRLKRERTEKIKEERSVFVALSILYEIGMQARQNLS